MWPFNSKTPRRASFPIGTYRLDAPIAGLSGLVEFTADQYAAMGRLFEGETNYNAPAINLFGHEWSVMLQTVNGFISKIAINVLLSTEQDANTVAMRLLGYCNNELGKPNEQRTGLFIWDTIDGNVILQTGETADGLSVGLFVTSKSIQTFKKRVEDAPVENLEKNLYDSTKLDDAKKLAIANMIAELLALQKMAAGSASIEDERGQPKRKAIGYVYGFVDAALRTKGLDMADMSIGVPITYQVIRRLWPDRATEYMEFLLKNMKTDALMNIGMMHGGQQYLDYLKPGATGVPMGLGRFMIEGD